jgi:hypothetical protein
MFKKAYENIIYPCKDKREWEDICGPPILPPLYQKHIGRPSITRRQAPGEVDHRRGGKKITRHGVIMHCSYCGEEDHNKKGCKYLKAGLPPPSANAASNVSALDEGNVASNVPAPDEGNDPSNVPSTDEGNASNVSPTAPSTQDDPVLTQQEPSAVVEDLLVDNLIAQV